MTIYIYLKDQQLLCINPVAVFGMFVRPEESVLYQEENGWVWTKDCQYYISCAGLVIEEELKPETKQEMIDFIDNNFLQKIKNNEIEKLKTYDFIYHRSGFNHQIFYSEQKNDLYMLDQKYVLLVKDSLDETGEDYNLEYYYNPEQKSIWIVNRDNSVDDKNIEVVDFIGIVMLIDMEMSGFEKLKAAYYSLIHLEDIDYTVKDPEFFKNRNQMPEVSR